MNYATDGRCHYAPPGSYNHECGRVASWIGTDDTGFECGYCEQHRVVVLRRNWRRIVVPGVAASPSAGEPGT